VYGNDVLIMPKKLDDERGVIGQMKVPILLGMGLMGVLLYRRRVGAQFRNQSLKATINS
jgi:hypothetical protein